jgi:hypothetical protein
VNGPQRSQVLWFGQGNQNSSEILGRDHGKPGQINGLSENCEQQSGMILRRFWAIDKRL